MERKLLLIRDDKRCRENETLGTLRVTNENGSILETLKTVELPWRGNQRRISCIPAGVYTCAPIIDGSGRWSILLENVPGRSEILVHIGNFTRQILGCILPGLTHADIDGDGIIDVTNSGKAMAILEKHITEPTTITIIEQRT